MELSTAIEYFLTQKRSENVSQATVDWYSNCLWRFAKRMLEVEDGSDVNATTIRSYIVKMQDDPGLKAISVNRNVRALRPFCKWLEAEGEIRSNPFDTNLKNPIKLPKFDQPEFHIIPDEDFRKLLAVCDRGTNPGRRDEAILMFLFDTGVRVGELVSLRTENLDLSLRQARIIGKGRKWRTVFFSAPTAVSLQRYIRRHGQKARTKYLPDADPTTTYVFTGLGKRPMTTWGVNRMLKRRATQAGVTNRVNPHSFRHTFATNYLRMGGDPATLQRILGHSDVSTTVRNYVHLVDADLRRAHDQFSPMGRALGRGR